MSIASPVSLENPARQSRGGYAMVVGLCVLLGVGLRLANLDASLLAEPSAR